MTATSDVDVHIVHDASGRILAIAPAAGQPDGSGALRGVAPVPAQGQFAIRLRLAAEHLSLGPVAIVRDYELDLSAEQPVLRAMREHER